MFCCRTLFLPLHTSNIRPCVYIIMSLHSNAYFIDWRRKKLTEKWREEHESQLSKLLGGGAKIICLPPPQYFHSGGGWAPPPPPQDRRLSSPLYTIRRRQIGHVYRNDGIEKACSNDRKYPGDSRGRQRLTLCSKLKSGVTLAVFITFPKSRNTFQYPLSKRVYKRLSKRLSRVIAFIIDLSVSRVRESRGRPCHCAAALRSLIRRRHAFTEGRSEI